MDKLLDLQKLDAKNDGSVIFAISWGSCNHHKRKTKSFYNSVQFSNELIGLIFIKNKRFFNNEVFI